MWLARSRTYVRIYVVQLASKRDRPHLGSNYKTINKLPTSSIMVKRRLPRCENGAPSRPAILARAGEKYGDLLIGYMLSKGHLVIAGWHSCMKMEACTFRCCYVPRKLGQLTSFLMYVCEMMAIIQILINVNMRQSTSPKFAMT